jgi:hypothetical protein
VSLVIKCDIGGLVQSKEWVGGVRVKKCFLGLRQSTLLSADCKKARLVVEDGAGMKFNKLFVTFRHLCQLIPNGLL